MRFTTIVVLVACFGLAPAAGAQELPPASPLRVSIEREAARLAALPAAQVNVRTRSERGVGRKVLGAIVGGVGGRD
jgi:hypothetical protein